MMRAIYKFRRIAILAASALLLSSAAVAQPPAAQPPAAPPAGSTVAMARADAVIPAGQEALVQRLLAPPGQPKPGIISIRKNKVVASWQEPTQLKLILLHPAATIPSGSTLVGKTSRFAVAVDGKLSTAMRDAIMRHIFQHELPFQWRVPARTPRPSDRIDATVESALQLIVQQARTSMRIGERAKALATAQAGKAHMTARPLTRARLGAVLLELGDTDGTALRDRALAELADQSLTNDAAKVDHLAAVALVDAKKAARLGRERVATLTGKAACAWVALADTLAASGRRDDGQALAESITKVAPKCKNAWLTAGGLLPHQEGGSKRALALAEGALAQIPDDLDLVFLRASALHGLWRNEEAAAEWEKVVAANPKHPGALGMLATAYTQGGQVTDDAFLQRFADRIAKNDKDVAARYVKGTIHYYRGEYQQVLDHLQPLFPVAPREPRIWLYTAMSEFHLGNVQRADKMLERIEKLAHDDPDYYYCRSVVNRHRDFEASLRDLETFVRLSRARQNSAAKVAKVERELEVMRTGRVPTAWDLWPAWLRWGLPAAGLLLLISIGIWMVRRRK